MKRHARWLVPLIAAPVIHISALAIMSALLTTMERGSTNVLVAIGLLVTPVAAYAGPVVAVVLAVRGGLWVYREPERARGRQSEAAAWDEARALRRRLIDRGVPPQLQVWDLVANDGEAFFYDIPAVYHRYYGQDVAYTQSSGFFFGHPAFVLAGLTLSTVRNARARAAAQAQATEQWREQQPCRLLVSNQRLACHVRGQWLSFYYSAMTAVYPEVGRWTLIAQFDSTAPLMLRGPLLPAAAVITVLMTHGASALEAHPSLHALDTRATTA